MNVSRRTLITSIMLLPVRHAAHAAGFDHSHAAWTALLKKHVVALEGGRRSQMRYAGMAADRAALTTYLESLSAVTAAEFEAFGKPQQMAFLINAYNAFTVELILTRYPKLAFDQRPGQPAAKPVEAEVHCAAGHPDVTGQHRTRHPARQGPL